MAALGLYDGTNTAAEHASEAARLGGDGPYRMRLATALLGAVQVEMMLVESAATGPEDLAAAHHRQLATAGVSDAPEKLAGFLRRQALRVAGHPAAGRPGCVDRADPAGRRARRRGPAEAAGRHRRRAGS